jgi:hypothetical protein
MTNELAHPGHVRCVREWLAHNSEKIASAVQSPREGDKHFAGEDFVLWLEKLLESHQRLCDREFARRPPFTQYTGD